MTLDYRMNTQVGIAQFLSSHYSFAPTRLLRFGVEFVNWLSDFIQNPGLGSLLVARKQWRLVYLLSMLLWSRRRSYIGKSVVLLLFPGQPNRRHCLVVPFSTAPQPSIAANAGTSDADAATAAAAAAALQCVLYRACRRLDASNIQ